MTDRVDRWEWWRGPKRIHLHAITLDGHPVIRHDPTFQLDRYRTACRSGPYATSTLRHPRESSRRVCTLCWTQYTNTVLVELAYLRPVMPGWADR